MGLMIMGLKVFGKAMVLPASGRVKAKLTYS